VIIASRRRTRDGVTLICEFTMRSLGQPKLGNAILHQSVGWLTLRFLRLIPVGLVLRGAHAELPDPVTASATSADDPCRS
jgi:hypothetical protein